MLDKSTLVRKIDGATPDEVVKHIEYYQNFCDGASRKGANGARMKLEYLKEPVRLGTTVFIASSRFPIADILCDKAPSTKIFVR